MVHYGLVAAARRVPMQCTVLLDCCTGIGVHPDSIDIDRAGPILEKDRDACAAGLAAGRGKLIGEFRDTAPLVSSAGVIGLP
jgi:hypothetical protein